MSHIKPKTFLDEEDNICLIKDFLKKDRYKKPFVFLYNFFANNSRVSVTILRENLYILDRSDTYHILESFRILNLLDRITLVERCRKGYYTMINQEYWERCIQDLNKPKEGEQDGSKREENGSNGEDQPIQ